jgi:MFS family permease
VGNFTDGTGWNPRFLLVSVLQFLAYANYNMLQPVLGLYLASLGYSPAFVGLIAGAFGFASVTTRPYIGRGVDAGAAVRTYLAGTTAMAAGTLGYLLSWTPILFISRLVHGTGWAAINTAGPAIALSHAPFGSRGAAIGYFNAFRGITVPLAPAIGLWIADAYGFPAVFLVAGVSVIVATAFVPSLGGLRPQPAPTHDGVVSGLIERRALVPAAVLTLLYCSAPLIFIFMPLFAEEKGINGLPLFYLAAGIVGIGVQPLARITDTRGRGPNIMLGIVLVAASLLVLAAAESLPLLVVGGVLWAGGIALVEPATTALTVDSVPIVRRGAALATYGAAFQVGQGLGGILCGLSISVFGFEYTFVAAALLAASSATLVVGQWSRFMSRDRPY